MTVRAIDTNTQQVLVGPDREVIIEVEGNPYHIDFLEDGGAPAGGIDLHVNRIKLSNTAKQGDVGFSFALPNDHIPIKHLYIMIHSAANEHTIYRLVTWAFY